MSGISAKIEILTHRHFISMATNAVVFGFGGSRWWRECQKSSSRKNAEKKAQKPVLKR